jgi:hypothetical protein
MYISHGGRSVGNAALKMEAGGRLDMISLYQTALRQIPDNSIVTSVNNLRAHMV